MRSNGICARILPRFGEWFPVPPMARRRVHDDGGVKAPPAGHRGDSRVSRTLVRAGRGGYAAARAEARGGNGPTLEELEPRALLTSVFTAEEVYFSELVNRARANPTAEGVRLGLNLGNGLTLAEQARLVAQEPLALNVSLLLAARAHSLDMPARSFFDHTNPSGQTPTIRAQAQGYAGTAGENIGAGHANVDALYRAWMAMPNERRNLLSLHAGFDATFHSDQIGPGFAWNISGAAYTSYFTADFGNPSAQARTQWLTGVVFTDADANAFYGIGEGLGGVRVDVFAGGGGAATGTPVQTFTTDDAGNYQIALGNGAYTVTFTRLSTGATVTRSATIDGQNVKLDARASELVIPPPPPPTDDHASAGAWSSATGMTVDPSTGHGAATGTLGTTSDSDLFTFIAPRAGAATITAARVGDGNMTVRVRIYNAAQTLIATGAVVGAGSEATATLIAGQRYYVLIDMTAGSSATNYAVAMEGPADEPDDDPAGADEEFLAGADHALATTLSAGKSTIAFINAAGTPYFAERDASGVWSAVNLGSVPGAAEITGELQSWIDRRDGLNYVAARRASDGHLLLFKRAGDGSWSVRDLTEQIRVSRPIVSGLAVFHDGDGLTQIAGLDAAGRMVTYWQTGAMQTNGLWKWFFTDMAERDLFRRGRRMPVVTGELTTYVTQRNSLNIVASNAAGDVLLFFRPGGGKATQLWNFVNITAQTRAARFVGMPTAYETTSRSVQITGTDVAGNVWSIYWREGAGWKSKNLTASLGGAPALMTEGVGSYANTGGVGFTVGVTSEGEVILYRYQFKNGRDTWAYASVSAAVSNPPRIVGPVSAAFRAGSILLAGRGEDGEAYSIAFTPSVGWTFESVSLALSA